MDFSETCQQTSGLAVWSPDGTKIASAAQHRVVIRDGESLKILQIWACMDNIQHLAWSCDSKYVLCAMYKRALVQVWSLAQTEWTCKIDEGPAGLVAARWAPDGRHIVCTSQFQLRITVWSLISRSALYIKFPKFGNAGLCFSSDGRYLAVVERKECRDVVGIFTTDPWEMVEHFQLSTHDVQDIAWVPNNHSLVAWDTSLEYSVHHYALNGEKLAVFKAYENALGIKQVQCSPSAQFVAVGSYDDRVRLLNRQTWRCVADFEQSAAVPSESKAVVYREEPVDDDASRTLDPVVGTTILTKTRYRTESLPVTLPKSAINADKPETTMGVGLVAWSSDGNYVATRCDSMPCVLSIWDVAGHCLTAVLIQTSPVRNAVWSPDVTQPPRLAICAGGARLYLWSPSGCSVVDTPGGAMNVTTISWRQDGQAILLGQKQKFGVAYLVDDQ